MAELMRAMKIFWAYSENYPARLFRSKSEGLSGRFTTLILSNNEPSMNACRVVKLCLNSAESRNQLQLIKLYSSKGPAEFGRDRIVHSDLSGTLSKIRKFPRQAISLDIDFPGLLIELRSRVMERAPYIFIPLLSFQIARG